MDVGRSGEGFSDLKTRSPRLTALDGSPGSAVDRESGMPENAMEGGVANRPATFTRAGCFLGLLVIVLAAAAEDSAPRPPATEKLLMGWLESVYLKPWNLRVTAKLDTGAKTSSLHADHIEHFSKEGQEWVRFTLVGSEDQKTIVVERPVARTAYIKERRSRASKREVVKLVLCKNGREYETEFTLVDRSNFNYPLLLGRSFLQDVALVDAGVTFLHKAETDPCRQQPPASSERGRDK